VHGDAALFEPPSEKSESAESGEVLPLQVGVRELAGAYGVDVAVGADRAVEVVDERFRLESSKAVGAGEEHSDSTAKVPQRKPYGGDPSGQRDR
jgi:hypothetical protein